jgi:hypothetical protein
MKPGCTETEEWMDRPTPGQTKLYNLERDGKFYISYPRQEQTASGALTFCWNDDATAVVPYPQQAKAIVAKYINQQPTQSGYYAAGIHRAMAEQTKWVTYDGKWDDRRETTLNYEQ